MSLLVPSYTEGGGGLMPVGTLAFLPSVIIHMDVNVPRNFHT